jgi:hypothetical protein
VKDGTLNVVEYHCFQGGNWAEVLKGQGYTFHRPCPPRDDVGVPELNDIEAKPRDAKEPRLKDALHTITGYLADKPAVKCYTWPPPERDTRTRRPRREDGGDDDMDWDHDVDE